MNARAPQNPPPGGPPRDASGKIKLSPAPPAVGKKTTTKTSLKIQAVNITIEGDSDTIQEGLQAFRDLFSALGSIAHEPTDD